MALSANRETERKEGVLLSIPVAAATHVYKGSLVCYNGAGYATPAANTAGMSLAGVAFEEINNTGSAGALSVRVYRYGLFKFVAAAMTQARVGYPAYVVDDTTVGYAAQATGYVGVGQVAYYESATSVWVDIAGAIAGAAAKP